MTHVFKNQLNFFGEVLNDMVGSVNLCVDFVNFILDSVFQIFDHRFELLVLQVLHVLLAELKFFLNRLLNLRV